MKLSTIECEHGSLKRQCLVCELQDEVAMLRETCGHLSDRLEVIAAENEALKKDAERLDWLIRDLQIDQIGDVDIHERACDLAGGEYAESHFLLATRQAIDAAIAAEAKP